MHEQQVFQGRHPLQNTNYLYHGNKGRAGTQESNVQVLVHYFTYEDSINFQKHDQRPKSVTIYKSLCLKQYCLRRRKRTSHGLFHSIYSSFVAEKSLSLTILIIVFCHIVVTWNVMA